MNPTVMKCVVSVWDGAAQAYAPPIVVPSRGVAVRSFIQEVNRPGDGNMLNTNPDDFELRLLAFWEESTGGFSPVAPAEVLARGKDVKQGA